MEKKIQVKCIKDVVMTDDARTAFFEGKTYDGEKNDWGGVVATNESGNAEHVINSKSGDLSKWFKEHFVITWEEGQDKNRLTPFIKTVLENERAGLELYIKSLKERLEQRKEQVKSTEEALESAENNLEDILEMLN